jgi:hypothetical protein
MFLSSDDSKEHFSQNSAGSFSVHLPERLFLKGKWDVALCELDYQGKVSADSVYICSGICESSVVGDIKLPVLRRISLKGKKKHYEFSHLFFIPVIHQEIPTINVFIRGEHGENMSVESGTVKCTLVFKRRTPFSEIVA